MNNIEKIWEEICNQKDHTLDSFLEFRKMAESGQFPDLTLDEINEEIRLAREERAAREKAGK